MAEKLQWASVRAKNELEVPTKALMIVLADRAKEYIGNYQSGWAPLAESTLNGWNGHPGKIELGYAPPDNPLLREGDMRESISGDAGLVPFGARGVVGSDSKIALYQEIGTIRIPPRPFLALAAMNGYDRASLIFGDFALKLLGPR
jgi:hypothetical protein